MQERREREKRSVEDERRSRRRRRRLRESYQGYKPDPLERTCEPSFLEAKGESEEQRRRRRSFQRQFDEEMSTRLYVHREIERLRRRETGARCSMSRPAAEVACPCTSDKTEEISKKPTRREEANTRELDGRQSTYATPNTKRTRVLS